MIREAVTEAPIHLLDSYVTTGHATPDYLVWTNETEGRDPSGGRRTRFSVAGIEAGLLLVCLRPEGKEEGKRNLRKTLDPQLGA